MNILKEQIKLSVAYPGWRSAIKKLRLNKNKKIFLFGTPMHGNLGDHAIAIQEQYFFEDFFQTEPEGSIWSIEKKLAQVRYLLADYLDGNTREYDHIFQLVNEWELGYGNSSSNVELLS